MNSEQAYHQAGIAIASYVVQFIESAVDLNLVGLLEGVLEKMRPAALFFGETAMQSWNGMVCASEPAHNPDPVRHQRYWQIVREMGILFTDEEFRDVRRRLG